MDRDEGSYQLSHAYDRFLDTAFSRRVKNTPLIEVETSSFRFIHSFIKTVKTVDKTQLRYI